MTFVSYYHLIMWKNQNLTGKQAFPSEEGKGIPPWGEVWGVWSGRSIRRQGKFVLIIDFVSKLEYSRKINKQKKN